ncbi:Ammonium transporter 1 [Fulvia fulva]|nr:Ammonium transporter 1 [Fulvia fulva]WPV18339.1 Ammonium transporter 1 [Fulvia fulva]
MSTPTAPEFNSSEPRGGDPLVVDVNAQYAGLEFHYVYLIFCAFIVWLIIPGIGLLYGGLARRKSSLSLLFQSLMVAAVTTFQWMFWGYSLAYSRTANAFIGDLSNSGLMKVRAAPSPGSAYIPEIVFCLYQLLFCACTVQIVIGGSFERGRILPSLIFSFFWATIVYCPIACWTWNSNGWLYNLPSLDFAGGGPVHIASGWAGLAYAFVLGKRKHAGETSHKKPHNTTLVFLGTVLIWFGWFGFNGGSALNATMRSMYAAFNTNVAASTGVLGWVTVDYIRTGGKFSVVGACEGAIAGLVGITPAAGYVSFWLAAVIGFVTAAICASLQKLNDWLNIDEGLEVFKLHGVGGMVGSFLTGIFADQTISALDGGTLAPGGINGNGVQVGKQFAEITAIGSYSFVVTCILLLILKYIPGMHLRVSEEAEMRGLDLDQFCDEQIGDWEFFEHQEAKIVTHGVPQHLPLSSAVSHEREAPKHDAPKSERQD